MDLFSTTYFGEIIIFVISKDQTFRIRCTLMNPEQFLILVPYLVIAKIYDFPVIKFKTIQKGRPITLAEPYRKSFLNRYVNISQWRQFDECRSSHTSHTQQNTNRPKNTILKNIYFPKSILLLYCKLQKHRNFW